ncbi:PCNT protein, partial [Cisticola juncidis]|nr:PCNT protein [Cisticola juncidis]
TTASGARSEVLREQQPPAVSASSPPTRDRPGCTARVPGLSPRSSRPHCRLHPSPSSVPDKSLVPPQDPEQSLTEYIHRLEMIQQRLRGAQPGQVLGSPHQRNLKK